MTGCGVSGSETLRFPEAAAADFVGSLNSPSSAGDHSGKGVLVSLLRSQLVTVVFYL